MTGYFVNSPFFVWKRQFLAHQTAKYHSCGDCNHGRAFGSFPPRFAQIPFCRSYASRFWLFVKAQISKCFSARVSTIDETSCKVFPKSSHRQSLAHWKWNSTSINLTCLLWMLMYENRAVSFLSVYHSAYNSFLHFSYVSRTHLCSYVSRKIIYEGRIPLGI